LNNLTYQDEFDLEKRAEVLSGIHRELTKLSTGIDTSEYETNEKKIGRNRRYRPQLESDFKT